MRQVHTQAQPGCFRLSFSIPFQGYIVRVVAFAGDAGDTCTAEWARGFSLNSRDVIILTSSEPLRPGAGTNTLGQCL